jgi:hypothetical protein
MWHATQGYQNETSLSNRIDPTASIPPETTTRGRQLDGERGDRHDHPERGEIGTPIDRGSDQREQERRSTECRHDRPVRLSGGGELLVAMLSVCVADRRPSSPQAKKRFHGIEEEER